MKKRLGFNFEFCTPTECLLGLKIWECYNEQDQDGIVIELGLLFFTFLILYENR